MADSREHIVNSALNLFLQKGFKEVTMKELVDNAGVSKGAFYHYFTSKEQIFEEVLMSFYNSLRVSDYDRLSTTSLLEFYKNWLQNFFTPASLISQATKDDSESGRNHYYIIFDGIRLVPSFREMFAKEQKREMAAWIKIIDIAKKSGEIQTTLSGKQVAKLFTYASDGLTSNLLMQSKISILKAEAMKTWDSLYTLLKA